MGVGRGSVLNQDTPFVQHGFEDGKRQSTDREVYGGGSQDGGGMECRESFER